MVYTELAASKDAERFVGDLVQLLPPKLVDVIFVYCEPENIFRLRNVSRTWNSYLTRPRFLQHMNIRMYANGGQYLLSPDAIQTRCRTFEDRVRNRRALSNGRACRLEDLKHPKGMGGLIKYHSGTLIGTGYNDRCIYVKRLYRDDSGWESLKVASFDDPEFVFSHLEITSRHILAYAQPGGQVYCWSAATLELLANFQLTTVPELDHGLSFNLYLSWIGASSNTIVMVSLRGLECYLYSLETETFTVVDIFSARHIDPIFSFRVEQSGYLYVRNRFDAEEYIDVFKINDTSTSIDFAYCINLYAVGQREISSIARDWDESTRNDRRKFEVVVAWDHKYFCATDANLETSSVLENKFWLVFELKDGIMTFHHALQHEHFWPIRALYYPQLHRTFGISNGSLGLYQLYDKTSRLVNHSQRNLVAPEAFPSRIPPHPVTGSDSDFLVCTLPWENCTRVWIFHEPDESSPRAGKQCFVRAVLRLSPTRGRQFQIGLEL